MKNTKLMLLGIAVILFGMCSILLAGLEGMPTFHNGVFELLGVACPIAGVVLSLIGLFWKDNKS